MKQIELNMEKKNPYAFEIKCMVIRETDAEQKRVRTPEDVYDAWMNSVRSAPWFCHDKECFVVFFLTVTNILRGFEMVTIGLLNSTLVHPREVFRAAITAGASAIVVAHNHPSGDTKPSAEDLRVTRQLVAAGKVIDIQLTDHVIIGDRRDDQPKHTAYLSMREEGMIVT